MMTKEDKDKMRDKLRDWMGDTTETVSEFECDGQLIWLVRWNSEATNGLTEWGMVRAFITGGEAVVSGDAMNCTPEEVLEAIGRVLR